MTGFNLSPAARAAIESMLQVSANRELTQGYLAFSWELDRYEWHKTDLWSCEMQSPLPVLVKLPDDADDRTTAYANLVAGLTLRLEEARRMVDVAGADDWSGEAVEQYRRQVQLIETHLFGLNDQVDDGGRRATDVEDVEEERAMIVAYTGLWQLRALAEGSLRGSEPDAFRAARIELRQRLDEISEARTTAAVVAEGGIVNRLLQLVPIVIRLRGEVKR